MPTTYHHMIDPAPYTIRVYADCGGHETVADAWQCYLATCETAAAASRAAGSRIMPPEVHQGFVGAVDDSRDWMPRRLNDTERAMLRRWRINNRS